MLVVCHLRFYKVDYYLLKQVSFIVFTDVPRDEGGNL